MTVRVLCGWLNFLSPEICQSVHLGHTDNLKAAFLKQMSHGPLCQVPVGPEINEAVHPVYEGYS